MQGQLWKYVKWMLTEDVDEPENGLLTEPDLPKDDGDEQEERSVVADIAGAITPLGLSLIHI